MKITIRYWSALCALLILGAMSAPSLAHDDFAPNPDLVANEPAFVERTDRLIYVSTSFEDEWPPTGWTVMAHGESYPWEQTNASANSGAHSAWVHYGPQGTWQDEWLVTPSLDLSGAIAPKLTFYEDEAYWSGYGDHHYISVSTTVPDDPAAFTILESWTPSNHTINGFGGDPVTVDLSSYAGLPNVYVAFRYIGEWADDWYIDDVSVWEPSEFDMAVLEAGPAGHHEGGDTILPTAIVENVGQSPFLFDVRFEVREAGSTLVFDELITDLEVSPGSTMPVAATSLLALGSGTFYEVTASIVSDTDEEAANDSATSIVDTYEFSHVPMMFLFTNSGCGPCVQANEAFDAYMPDQGNTVALMRIHAWWPYGGDIMFTANSSQCTEYVNEYAVSGVPDIWLDGFQGLGTSGTGAVAAAEAAKMWASPMTITPLFWDPANERLHLEVDISSPLPESDYRLVCCITEDGIEHNGGNGEPIHNQAFRAAYPGIEGTPISVDVGLHNYEVDMPLDAWEGGPFDFDNLRATCYVQDRGNNDYRRIIESGTEFLHVIEDATAVDASSSPKATILRGAWPNPFNPKTSISFSVVADGPARMTVHDIQGRHVATLLDGPVSAGDHTVAWNGLSDGGQSVGSGVYLVRFMADGNSTSLKVVLTK